MVVVNSDTADTLITSQVDLALHAAMRDFVRLAEPQSFRMDGDLTLVSGTRDYQLPGDLMKIIEPGVFFTTADFRTLSYVNEQVVREHEWDRAQRSSEPTFYSIRGKDQYTGDWNVRLYPTPNTARTVRVHYLGLPLPLWPNKPASYVVDPRLQAEFHHAIIVGAVTQLPRYLNMQVDLIQYERRWVQYLEDAKHYSLPVAGQAYQRESYSAGPSWPGSIQWGTTPTSIPG